MENYQHKEYESHTANRLMATLKKNGVFLSTEETIDISNQLEKVAQLEKDKRDLENTVRGLMCTALQAFKYIKQGNTLADTCNYFGIELPDEKNYGGEFVIGSVHFLNQYLKRKKHEGGGYEILAYNAETHEEIKDSHIKQSINNSFRFNY